MKRLLAAAVFSLGTMVAAAEMPDAHFHDLTDPTVKGSSTSVELQVHHDKLVVDVWVQYRDLAAQLWRQGAAGSGTTISADDVKSAVGLFRGLLIEYSLLVELPGPDGKLRSCELEWVKETAFMGDDFRVDDTPVKINYQWTVKGFKPEPGRKYEAQLVFNNSDQQATRLNGRVILEGNSSAGIAPGARETFESVRAGRDAPMGRNGFILSFWFQVPQKLERPGDFFTTEGKYVDMTTGQLFDRPPARGFVEQASRFFDDKIRGFLKSNQRPPLGIALLFIVIALAYGMAHAVSPGHGKTLVAAYLVGSHGKIRHAILLGLTVTLSHVGAIVALGFAMLFWKVNSEGAVKWISLVSGITIIGMGAYLFYTRWRFGIGHVHGPGGHTHLPGHAHTHDHGHPHSHDHDHDHDHAHEHHDHDHEHGHDHAHGPDGHVHWKEGDDGIETVEPVESGSPDVTAWDLITTGVLGGMVPCPAALLILLLAIGVQKVAWGLVLLGAFSLGLGGVLSLIGVLLITGKRLLAGRMEASGIWLRRAAIASSLVIFTIGVMLTVQAIRDLKA